MSEYIGREEYVRLLCNGYLIIGQPIPEEFWDEWEEIQAKDAALAPKSVEERLLEIDPEPLEVWVVLKDGNEFQVLRSGPTSGGFVTLVGTSPYTGEVDHGRLQRLDGTVLAQFDILCNALVAGDTVTVTIDAAHMLKMLTP